MVLSIVLCFILTIIIELAVLYIFKERNKKVYIAAIIINAMTNIPLNIFTNNYTFTGIANYLVIILSLELLVVVVESLLYFIVIRKYTKCLFYSTMCNLYSFLLGSLVFEFIMKYIIRRLS